MQLHCVRQTIFDIIYHIVLQDDCIGYFNITPREAPTRLVKSKPIYDSEGNFFGDYTRVNGSIWRYGEYYKNSAYLKFSVDIYQVFYVDTLYVIGGSGSVEVKIDSGYRDVFHGNYQEFDTIYFIQTVKGQYVNGQKVGKWYKQVPNGARTVIEFSEEGLPEGIYEEYYPGRVAGAYKSHYADITQVKGALKWKGQFAVIEYLHPRGKNHFQDVSKGAYSRVKTSRKSGLWQHFTINGRLLEEVTYEWKLP